MRAVVSVASGLALMVAIGCDDGSPSPGGGGPDAGGEASGLQPPPDGEGVQLRMSATIRAGEENEKCRFIEVGPEGLNIARTNSLYTPGSHHMLLYTTPYSQIPTANEHGDEVVYETAEGVFDCSDGAAADWQVIGVVGGAQNSESELFALPDGVALQVPANTVLILNTHYLNASDHDLDAEVYLNLWTIPDDQVDTRAGIIFFYNPYIHVPAGASASSRFVCPISKEITLLNGQSHMHARGTGYEAFVLDSDWNRVGDGPLLVEDDWASPEIQELGDGGVVLEAGQYIDYRCDYYNGESEDKYQGLSANDEMCMFIGAYYPYDGPLELCAPATDNFLDLRFQAGVPLGNGTQHCQQSLGIVLESGFSRATQAAVMATCPAHGVALKRAFSCAGAAQGGDCAGPCTDGGQDCQSCVETACGEEFGECAELAPCE